MDAEEKLEMIKRYCEGQQELANAYGTQGARMNSRAEQVAWNHSYMAHKDLLKIFFS